MTEKYKTVVKMYDEHGTEVTSFVQNSWTKYLNGHWTLTAPTKPGRYTVANYTGRVVGEAIVHEVGGVTKPVFKASSQGALEANWEVYFWSEPIPTRFPSPFPVAEAIRLTAHPGVLESAEAGRLRSAGLTPKPSIHLVED
jgi:hypothetical protein